MKQTKAILRITVCMLLVMLMIFTLFPVVWMVSTSFKGQNEVYKNPPTLLPERVNVEGYANMLFQNTDNVPFLKWVKNSLIVAVMTTVVSMAIAVCGGYGLARFRFPGRDFLSYFILICEFLPGSLLILPMFLIMTKLNLHNTYAGLVICYITFSIPFCTWMMKGFYETIPATLEEAAMIDGCNRFGAFVRVITPLTLPGLVSTAIFSFITAWNEFLFASIFLKTYDRWTLPIGLMSFDGHYAIDWNSLMAGSVLITLPIVVIFLLLQRYLVSGMTAGAVKQ